MFIHIINGPERRYDGIERSPLLLGRELLNRYHIVILDRDYQNTASDTTDSHFSNTFDD